MALLCQRIPRVMMEHRYGLVFAPPKSGGAVPEYVPQAMALDVSEQAVEKSLTPGVALTICFLVPATVLLPCPWLQRIDTLGL